MSLFLFHYLFSEHKNYHEGVQPKVLFYFACLCLIGDPWWILWPYYYEYVSQPFEKGNILSTLYYCNFISHQLKVLNSDFVWTSEENNNHTRNSTIVKGTQCRFEFSSCMLPFPVHPHPSFIQLSLPSFPPSLPSL